MNYVLRGSSIALILHSKQGSHVRTSLSPSITTIKECSINGDLAEKVIIQNYFVALGLESVVTKIFLLIFMQIKLDRLLTTDTGIHVRERFKTVQAAMLSC